MGQKLKIVLSDLHLGAGHTHNNYLEDFTADQTLCNLWHRLWRESQNDQREVELIINGDFFEFLQVPAVNHYNPEQIYAREDYLDSSEKASIKRLNIIAEGHPEVFNALSDFIHVESPQRRITIIKGNHDVNLFWPRVKSRLREILGASGTRASLLLFADEFVSREKIYIEHGHQRAETMNRYPDFFNPRSPEDMQQLYYPPGSRFIIENLNTIEQEHWYVDHIKPMTTFIWYAFDWNFDFAAQLLAHFIRHTATTDEALVEDLEDNEKRQQLARRYADEPSFRQQFHRQIQQYLNVIKTDPPPADDNPVTMGQHDQQQQQALLLQAAETVAEREGARVILFGHTHYATQHTLNNGSVYINTGSWIEDFSDAPPETWAELFNGSRPPDRATCLPYARIDYDQDNLPTAQLLYAGGPDTNSKNRLQNLMSRLARTFGVGGQ